MVESCGADGVWIHFVELRRCGSLLPSAEVMWSRRIRNCAWRILPFRIFLCSKSLRRHGTGAAKL